MCQTTALLCYFRAKCKWAVGGGCFAPPFFFFGKLRSLFQVSIALSNPSLYLLSIHPRRDSASLILTKILTNKGKTVIASKVTSGPKESAPAGKGMEISAPKSLGMASTLLSSPKMHSAGSK